MDAFARPHSEAICAAGATCRPAKNPKVQLCRKCGTLRYRVATTQYVLCRRTDSWKLKTAVLATRSKVIKDFFTSAVMSYTHCHSEAVAWPASLVAPRSMVLPPARTQLAKGGTTSNAILADLKLKNARHM